MKIEFYLKKMRAKKRELASLEQLTSAIPVPQHPQAQRASMQQRRTLFLTEIIFILLYNLPIGITLKIAVGYFLFPVVFL